MPIDDLTASPIASPTRFRATPLTTLGRMLLAEAVGTFVLVFLGCGAIMVDARTDRLRTVGIALAFGLSRSP